MQVQGGSEAMVMVIIIMAKVMVMRAVAGDHETSPVGYREHLWLGNCG